MTTPNRRHRDVAELRERIAELETTAANNHDELLRWLRAQPLRQAAQAVDAAERAMLDAVLRELIVAQLTATQVEGPHTRVSGIECAFPTRHWALELAGDSRIAAVAMCFDGEYNDPYPGDAAILMRFPDGRWVRKINRMSFQHAFDSLAATNGGPPLQARITGALRTAREERT